MAHRLPLDTVRPFGSSNGEHGGYVNVMDVNRGRRCTTASGKIKDSEVRSWKLCWGGIIKCQIHCTSTTRPAYLSLVVNELPQNENSPSFPSFDSSAFQKVFAKTHNSTNQPFLMSQRAALIPYWYNFVTTLQPGVGSTFWLPCFCPLHQF